jgi:hypothetical protein
MKGHSIMAINGVLSVQVQDADKEKTSFQIPFSNSTSLLADILAWAAGLLSLLDVIIDTKELKAKICLSIPIPGGVKATPAAGAEIERTGLIGFDTPSVFSNYSEDIPGFAYAKFVGNTIPLADTDVAAYVDYVRLVNHNCQGTDRDGNVLGVVTKGEKTFRKHRKSTARS